MNAHAAADEADLDSMIGGPSHDVGSPSTGVVDLDESTSIRSADGRYDRQSRKQRRNIRRGTSIDIFGEHDDDAASAPGDNIEGQIASLEARAGLDKPHGRNPCIIQSRFA